MGGFRVSPRGGTDPKFIPVTSIASLLNVPSILDYLFGTPIARSVPLTRAIIWNPIRGPTRSVVSQHPLIHPEDAESKSESLHLWKRNLSCPEEKQFHAGASAQIWRKSNAFEMQINSLFVCFFLE